MSPISTPFLNTDKLNQFALFLRNDAKKIIDAIYVENLIDAIVNHPAANKDCVKRWLQSSFNLPSNCDNDKCNDVYNRSFYHSITEKL